MAKKGSRMNSIEMLLACRQGQKILGDEEPLGPISIGPFVDDHGEMVTYVREVPPAPGPAETGP